jgi:hypothetical protein
VSDACASVEVENRRSYYGDKVDGFSIWQADTANLPEGVTVFDMQRRKSVFAYVRDHQRMLLSKLAMDIYRGMTPEQQQKGGN